MTKVAIIGAGPCGLSMLRSFELAEKNGCQNYFRVPALGTNENYIKAMSNLIINKQNFNLDGKLFPPKIKCPNQFKKCPCQSHE